MIVEEGEVHERGVCMSNALRNGQDESMKQRCMVTVLVALS